MEVAVVERARARWSPLGWQLLLSIWKWGQLRHCHCRQGCQRCLLDRGLWVTSRREVLIRCCNSGLLVHVSTVSCGWLIHIKQKACLALHLIKVFVTQLLDGDHSIASHGSLLMERLTLVGASNSVHLRTVNCLLCLWPDLAELGALGALTLTLVVGVGLRIVRAVVA